ncbi:DUF4184 family protein [Flavobacterium sp.]|uniref:DUF4184 family protein n=1 Tax=Flavobacterium sp. TaxID=239 RepID=UPI003D6A0997
MPFTFSHPAIVLPLLKNHKLSATGLVIGAMCPDFEYFIKMKVESSMSHTFLGLFLFNLPVGLLIAVLFHSCIKKSLVDNLPAFVGNRLNVLRNSNWIDYLKRNVVKVLISILIGAASHILWDSFTHKTGYFVTEIPFLQQQIKNIPYYKIAQHLSSLFGMLFLLYFLLQFPAEEKQTQFQHPKYWLFVVFLTIAFTVIRFVFCLSLAQIGNVIVSVISSIILAMTFAGLAFGSKKIKH